MNKHYFRKAGIATVLSASMVLGMGGMAFAATSDATAATKATLTKPTAHQNMNAAKEAYEEKLAAVTAAEEAKAKVFASTDSLVAYVYNIYTEAKAAADTAKTTRTTANTAYTTAVKNEATAKSAYTTALGVAKIRGIAKSTEDGSYSYSGDEAATDDYNAALTELQGIADVEAYKYDVEVAILNAYRTAWNYKGAYDASMTTNEVSVASALAAQNAIAELQTKVEKDYATAKTTLDTACAAQAKNSTDETKAASDAAYAMYNMLQSLLESTSDLSVAATDLAKYTETGTAATELNDDYKTSTYTYNGSPSATTIYGHVDDVLKKDVSSTNKDAADKNVSDLTTTKSNYDTAQAATATAKTAFETADAAYTKAQQTADAKYTQYTGVKANQKLISADDSSTYEDYSDLVALDTAISDAEVAANSAYKTYDIAQDEYQSAEAVKVKTPSVTVKAGKKKIKVTIKKVSNAKSYTIKYKKKGASKYKSVTTTSKKKTIKNLKKGKKYVVKVRANAKNSDYKTSSYSKTKTVKVK